MRSRLNHMRTPPGRMLCKLAASTFLIALMLGGIAGAEAANAHKSTGPADIDVSAIAPEMDLVKAARQLIREVDNAPRKIRFLARGKLGQSADHARTHGRYIAAAMLVDHAIGLLKNSPIYSPARLAAERADLADLQRRIGHFSESERNFESAIELLRDTGQDGQSASAALLFPMALNDADREQFDQAEILLKRLLDRTGTADPRAVPVLNELGRVYRLQHRFHDAEATLKQALAIVENGPFAAAGGGLSRLTFDAMGRLYQDWGRYADAERFYRRNLDADESRGLSGDPQLSRSLDRMGELFLAEGRLGDAERVLTRALAILKPRLGPPLPLVGNVANNLANVLTSEHRYAEAKPLFERAIAIKSASVGTDHPDFAATLVDVAGWFDAQGRPGGSAPLYKRAAEIYAKALGPDNPKTIAARGKHSNFQASRNDDENRAFE